MHLPYNSDALLQNIALIIITLAIIAVVFPIFLAAIGLISIYFFALIKYFRPAQVQSADPQSCSLPISAYSCPFLVSSAISSA